MQRRQAGRDRPPGLYSKGLLDEVALWSYKLGGCQVIKKWLSYREQGVLGRCRQRKSSTWLIPRGGLQRHR